MKATILLIAALTMAMSGHAQSKDSDKKIPTTYDRSSITFLALDFVGTNHAAELRNKVEGLKFTEKYYNNNLSSLTLVAPHQRADKTVNVPEALRVALEKNRIPNEIIAKWYAQKADGSMSLDLIHERGMFNATDAAFLLAQSTKRGDALLKDYGDRLINRSYILVVDFADLKTFEEAGQPAYRGWQSNAVGYLFKIDYTEEIRNQLYDNWINEDDPASVKIEKKQKMDALTIPVRFVTSTALTLSESQAKDRSAASVALLPNKSSEQLLMDLVQKGYDENLYALEKQVEDFKVKTTINQVRPLRAKIGKKEGIKTDYRFFAYENVYNEKTNASVQKFRGVIRATSKIADNNTVSTGNSGTTVFYQTAGRRLQTGYLLHQRNESGLEIGLASNSGEVGGLTCRLDARMGRVVGIQALYVYIEGGLQMKSYPDYYNSPADYVFTRYDVGMAKGLQLGRNMEFRPYVGYGIEQTNDSYYGDVSTVYYKVGANLSLNLRHNIQLFGGSGFSIFTEMKDADDNPTGWNWADYFPYRGGLTTVFGLKVGF
jgi:hypothetical protein